MDIGADELHKTGQYAIALVVGVGIAAQWLANRLGLPSILLLLAAGLLVGGVGFQLFDPATMLPTQTLFDFVSVSVAIILFEGGLSLKFNELRRGGTALRRMLWIGIPLTMSMVVTLYHLLYAGSWEFSFLVGALLVVTGPTVIGPLLRQVQPTGGAGPIVKWEGILNDPIGAIFAVLMLEVVVARGALHSWGSVALGLGFALVVGVLGGGLCAWILVMGIRRSLIQAHLQGAVAVALCVILFVVANSIQAESGLLAVTVFGICLANQRTAKMNHIRNFHEHLRTLLIAVLFVVLAARFTLAQLTSLDWRIAWFLLGLIVLVRPVSVAVATYGTGLQWRDRVLMAWMAPRGIVAAAVASLFAINLHKFGIDEARQLEPLVYAVIVGTVIVYGLGAKPLAQWLGLRPSKKQGVLLVGAHAWSRSIGRALYAAGHPVHFLDVRREHIKAAQMDGLSACDLSVLDERIESEGDLPSGIGVMLALSASNEENTLAVMHYEARMGLENVYQIVVDKDALTHGRQLKPSFEYSGNILFSGKVTYGDMQERYAKDPRCTITRITEKYTGDDYLHGLSDQAMIILIIKSSGKIVPVLEVLPEIKTGDKVLALIPSGKQTPAEKQDV